MTGSSIGTAVGEDRETASLYHKPSIGIRMLTTPHVASFPLLDFDLSEPRSNYIFPSGGEVTSPGRIVSIVKMKQLLRAIKHNTPQRLVP